MSSYPGFDPSYPPPNPHDPAYPPPGSQGQWASPPPPYSQPGGQPMVYNHATGLTPYPGPTGPPPPNQQHPNHKHAQPTPQYNRPPPPSNQGHERTPPGEEGAGRGRKTGLSMFNKDWAGTSFSEKAIRKAFIRKVYLILLSQLAITIGVICLFIFHQPTKQFVQQHSYIYYISYAIFFVMFIVLYCCHSVRRKVPANYICLFIFTLALSYMAGSISSYHDTNIVLICMAMTAVVVLCITLFVMQNKIDFTGGCCTAVLIVLVIVLVLTFIATMVVWALVPGQWWLQVLLGGIAALVMCLMLAIDTQMIMGGGRNKLSPEEYVVAALDLYIDIVYLFLALLCMMGGVGK